jgi:hypothetical protein
MAVCSWRSNAAGESTQLGDFVPVAPIGTIDLPRTRRFPFDMLVCIPVQISYANQTRRRHQTEEAGSAYCADLEASRFTFISVVKMAPGSLLIAHGTLR